MSEYWGWGGGLRSWTLLVCVEHVGPECHVRYGSSLTVEVQLRADQLSLTTLEAELADLVTCLDRATVTGQPQG
jgi:hypothetical protein